MRLLEKIDELLQEHKFQEESHFVKVLTPIDKKQGWVVRLMCDEKDGQIDIQEFNNPILDVALQDMLGFIKEMIAHDEYQNERHQTHS